LYITVEKYGAVYTVINSAVVVTAKATLVDLKSGTTIWSGSASASSEEANNNQNTGGLLGALIAGVIKQALNSAGDKGRDISNLTSQRLLSARPTGILFGPRSPKFGKDDPTSK
jgi:hypothetical protein